MTTRQKSILLFVYIALIAGIWSLTLFLTTAVDDLTRISYELRQIVNQKTNSDCLFNLSQHILFPAMICMILCIFSTLTVAYYIFRMGSPGGYFLGRLEPKGKIVYNKYSRRVKKILADDEFHWYWNDHYHLNYELFEPLFKQNFSIRVAPITANPDMRRLICEVTVAPPTDIEGYRKLSDKLGKEFPKFRKNVLSLLYDFCEENSVFLGTLFNPYRKEQRDKFNTLIFEFLQLKLNEFGLSLENSKFYFAN